MPACGVIFAYDVSIDLAGKRHSVVMVNVLRGIFPGLPYPIQGETP